MEKSALEVLGTPEPVYPKTADFGWKDITGQVLVRGVAATDPAWAQIGSSPFYAYSFNVNDFVWFIFHVPHDIVPGFPVFFHTHWITDGTSTAAVVLEYTYTYAKGFNQANFDSVGTVVTASQAAAGTAYRHMVTETAAVNISGLTEPDGIIYVRCRRITNGGTDNADGVFMLTSDVHHQSTNTATLNKAPDFYHA